jgi:hypothetical protein
MVQAMIKGCMNAKAKIKIDQKKILPMHKLILSKQGITNSKIV